MKLVKITTAVAIPILAGVICSRVSHANRTSLDVLVSANIEALSGGNDATDHVRNCYKNISGDKNYGDLYDVTYCGRCPEPTPVTRAWNDGMCKY